MPGVGAGIGHVHFMFFVLISFAFCSQRKPSFRWNMGFIVTEKKKNMFRDRSLITGGGVQNGKIAGLIMFASPPPQLKMG